MAWGKSKPRMGTDDDFERHEGEVFWLGQDILNHSSMDVGEAEISTLIFEN